MIHVTRFHRRLVARARADHGQTTAEYALILIVVAAIAMGLLAWVRRADTLTRFFNAVLESLIDLVP